MYTHLQPGPLFPASAAAIAHEDPARAALRGSLAVPATCQTAVIGLLEDHAVMPSSSMAAMMPDGPMKRPNILLERNPKPLPVREIRRASIYGSVSSAVKHARMNEDLRKATEDASKEAEKESFRPPEPRPPKIRDVPALDPPSNEGGASSAKPASFHWHNPRILENMMTGKASKSPEGRPGQGPPPAGHALLQPAGDGDGVQSYGNSAAVAPSLGALASRPLPKQQLQTSGLPAPIDCGASLLSQPSSSPAAMTGPFDSTGVGFTGAVPVPFKPAKIKGPPPPPGSTVVSFSDDDYAKESEESESEESESEREESEELPCFCNSRTAPTAADFAFAGVYVQCERCSRWCHGVCADLTRKDAAQLERYLCPPCRWHLMPPGSLMPPSPKQLLPPSMQGSTHAPTSVPPGAPGEAPVPIQVPNAAATLGQHSAAPARLKVGRPFSLKAPDGTFGRRDSSDSSMGPHGAEIRGIPSGLPPAPMAPDRAGRGVPGPSGLPPAPMAPGTRASSLLSAGLPHGADLYSCGSAPGCSSDALGGYGSLVTLTAPPQPPIDAGGRAGGSPGGRAMAAYSDAAVGGGSGSGGSTPEAQQTRNVGRPFGIVPAATGPLPAAVDPSTARTAPAAAAPMSHMPPMTDAYLMRQQAEAALVPLAQMVVPPALGYQAYYGYGAEVDDEDAEAIAMLGVRAPPMSGCLACQGRHRPHSCGLISRTQRSSVRPYPMNISKQHEVRGRGLALGPSEARELQLLAAQRKRKEPKHPGRAYITWVSAAAQAEAAEHWRAQAEAAEEGYGRDEGHERHNAEMGAQSAYAGGRDGGSSSSFKADNSADVGSGATCGGSGASGEGGVSRPPKQGGGVRRKRLKALITPRNRREEQRMLAMAIRESKGLPRSHKVGETGETGEAGAGGWRKARRDRRRGRVDSTPPGQAYRQALAQWRAPAAAASDAPRPL